jgi:predicted GNAT superfamily acetyltransferase
MFPPPASPPVEIRHCTTLTEFEDCLRLEHEVWGWGDDITVPVPLFVVAHHTGGQVLGAFDGTKMVGFTLALSGARGGQTFLHSHMTAVLPEYRDGGVGRRLKLFQRDDAIRHGIGLIEWTFDPLELKNAHFNLVRLGAIVRRYIPNCYGITNSPLHAGLPTDRLVAEWWLDSPRVKAMVEANPLLEHGEPQRFSLPAGVAEIKMADPSTAARIQAGLRDYFLRAFGNGQAVTSIERRGEQIDYIFRAAGQIAGLTLPGAKDH